MIHTLTIQYRLFLEEITALLNHLKYDRQTIHDFFYPGREKSFYFTDSPNILGFHEIAFANTYGYDFETRKPSRFFTVYLKIEPLSIIKGIKEIKLFECTQDNIQSLSDAFYEKMKGFLDIKDDHDRIEFILDFKDWEVQRVDYTHDVHFDNHDMVLVFMNLAKLTAISSRNKLSENTSTYGDNFYEKSFTIGNKSWELTIYDKEAEIASEEGLFPDTRERLMNEAHGVARIEYRRKAPGTKKSSTNLESRNVMEFLSEDMATKWLYGCYEELIGYEDFYTLYHAEKKLDEAFPMSDNEIRLEQQRMRKAAKTGEEYAPAKHSKKAQKYLDYMIDISSRKGINNALEAAKDDYITDVMMEAAMDSIDSSIETDQNAISIEAEAAAKAVEGEATIKAASMKTRFRRHNKAIREKAGISPILLPDAWIYKRKNKYTGKPFDIPHDIFKNPVPRPQN